MGSEVRLFLLLFAMTFSRLLASDVAAAKEKLGNPEIKETKGNPLNLTIIQTVTQPEKVEEKIAPLPPISQAQKSTVTDKTVTLPPEIEKGKSKQEEGKDEALNKSHSIINEKEEKQEKTTLSSETTAAPATTPIPKPAGNEEENDDQLKDGVLPMSEEDEQERKKIEEKEKFLEDEIGTGTINKANVVSNQRSQPMEAESEDGHFFQWMVFLLVIVVIGYLAMHNKRRILALVLEGRSGRRSSTSRGSARYHRLSQHEHENVIY